MSPYLLAWYAERSATPSRPATEATFTMLPEPAASISRPKLRAQQERPEQIDLEHAAPLLPSGLLVATRLRSHSAHRVPGTPGLRDPGTPGLRDSGTKYLERVRLEVHRYSQKRPLPRNLCCASAVGDGWN